jgi:glycosyltransferase involved in cell wall biosynthesis
MEKTVSIIIPAFNYGKYITEALESALAQTVPCEIIVVDDESTDNTADIVKKYPVKYIWQNNKGLAGARNTGIREATGNYIMSFDADDILRPDAIKQHLALLKDEKSIATCALMAFGSQNYTAYPRKATIPILLQTNCIYSNSLFPKQAWIDIGGFDESEIMRYGWEDREAWLRMIGKGYESVVGTYVALLWRRHENNMSEATANPHAQVLQDYIYNKNKNLLDL